VRRFAVVLASALALSPSALAGGANPAGIQGGEGAVLPDGSIRYVAEKAGADTVLTSRAVGEGTVLGKRTLVGKWGIPRIDAATSISHDGGTLVLARTTVASPTTFKVIDTKQLTVRKTITLRGAYAFDALSPDGSLLYVVGYASSKNIGRYVVRAVDVRTGRLLKGRIADKTQQSWVMQGLPVTRVSSADGRWAYTLYANPGGYPFVHALDTVNRSAHCVGVPWRGDGNEPWGMRLALRLDGKSLAVNRSSGLGFVAIDLSSWKISYLNGSGG
jgi:hypothetical protein